MFYKGKANCNHRFYLLLTIFSYHRFQEKDLLSINPFHSLWKNKLQILNNCVVIRLCKWKKTINLKLQISPHSLYLCDCIYFFGGGQWGEKVFLHDSLLCIYNLNKMLYSSSLFTYHQVGLSTCLVLICNSWKILKHVM